jgi:hypothetical protein
VCVINMMEETLQICERAHRSTQDASHRKTFPFSLRPSSDAYARQVAKSIQIQSGWQHPSGDLKVKTCVCRDPLDVPCIYHKGARHTLRGCRLGRRSTRSATPHVLYGLPHLQTMMSSKWPGSASPPMTKDPPSGASWWFRRTTHLGPA